jgi:hypothetical protein
MRRMAVISAAAVLVGVAVTGSASAGSPGSAVSLGRVGAIEYLKAVQPGVVTQEGLAADCDAEDSATGGGGTISGSPANSALNRTAPSGAGNGWRAEGSTTGITSRKVTTYAICGHAEILYSVAGGTVSPAGELGDVTGTTQGCSESEIALGGADNFGGNVRIVQNRPIGLTDWTMTAQNHASVQGTYSIWYGCSDAYDVSRRAKSTTVRRGDVGQATATCKRGEAVINGGFAMTAGGEPKRDTWATSTRPFDSDDRKKTPDDGWTVRAYNDSNAKAGLTVYAVCAAK